MSPRTWPVEAGAHLERRIAQKICRRLARRWQEQHFARNGGAHMQDRRNVLLIEPYSAGFAASTAFSLSAVLGRC